MTLWVTGLVLCTAVVHASWNAVLRSGADQLWSVSVMAMAGGLVAVLCLPFVPVPPTASWPYLVASFLIHIFYRLFLAYAYRWGELGAVYPIARGSAPLLVAAGAWLLVGEALRPLALAGIALISLGILSLARRRPDHRIPRRALVLALATGVCIAGYMVADGIGSRLSGNALGYALWLETLCGFPMPLILLATRGGFRGAPRPGDGWRSAAGGVLSIGAYALIIWAMTLGALGAVSALRETSVVFAAFIGRFFLGERLGWRRLAACCVIAAGVVCLSLAR